jgi:hypothetical protein
MMFQMRFAVITPAGAICIGVGAVENRGDYGCVHGD